MDICVVSEAQWPHISTVAPPFMRVLNINESHYQLFPYFATTAWISDPAHIILPRLHAFPQIITFSTRPLKEVPLYLDVFFCLFVSEAFCARFTIYEVL